jgi:nitrite reductase/ring-hydroxylating ferredoxin subunit
MVFRSRMSENQIDPKRRRFLLSVSAATLGAGALGAMGGGCSGGNPMGDAGTDGGPRCRTEPNADGHIDTCITVGDLEAGQSKLIVTPDDEAYLIARDALGFYSMSMLCTHEFCLLSPPNAMGQITCMCAHGSVYSSNGQILQRATIRPVANQGSLPHYRVIFDGTGPTARILIDPSTEVTDPGSRVPPPPSA